MNANDRFCRDFSISKCFNFSFALFGTLLAKKSFPSCKDYVGGNCLGSVIDFAN
jgi:hypothetical protein